MKYFIKYGYIFTIIINIKTKIIILLYLYILIVQFISIEIIRDNI